MTQIVSKFDAVLLLLVVSFSSLPPPPLASARVAVQEVGGAKFPAKTSTAVSSRFK